MKSSRKVKVGLILLLMSGMGLIVAANLWKSDLILKTVEVEGTNTIERNEIVQLAQARMGERMDDLDLLAIRERVSSHFFVKDVVVERDLPSTLVIRITERQPAVILPQGELFYLDEDGVVLPNLLAREVFDLPVLTGLGSPGSLKAGDRLTSGQVKEALQILRGAKLLNKELYHLISEVALRGEGDIVLYTAEGGVPILFGRGDIPRKLVYLESFWKEVLSVEGTGGLQYIDVRFEDQVVVRWKASHAQKHVSTEGKKEKA